MNRLEVLWTSYRRLPRAALWCVWGGGILKKKLQHHNFRGGKIVIFPSALFSLESDLDVAVYTARTTRPENK